MSKFIAQVSCMSAQPTAAADGATAGGARVTLVQRVTSGDTSKGVRVELFTDNPNQFKVGDVLTLELR